MRQFRYFILLIPLFLFGVLTTQAAMNSTNYSIWADVIGGGGGYDTSANYKLWDTLAEGIIDTASSTTYGVKQGFQLMVRDPSVTLSLSSRSLNFGKLSSATPQRTGHTMTVSTNASGGYIVVVSGDTLTSSSDSISAIVGTAVASQAGIEQFGFNVINPSGTAPLGTTVSNYGTDGLYAFSRGDTVAQSSGPVNETTYHINYIANVSASTASGGYSATLTFTATGNF